MRKPQNRPPRGNKHKVAIMARREEEVTQLQLARIQQLQSDLAQPVEVQSDLARLQEALRKEWNTLRMQLLRGIPVEPGPIRAFLRKSGNTQKLFIK
jgi:hypothetical protein